MYPVGKAETENSIRTMISSSEYGTNSIKRARPKTPIGYLSRLPEELIWKILDYIDTPKTLTEFSQTCRKFRKFCEGYEDIVWNRFLRTYFPSFPVPKRIEDPKNLFYCLTQVEKNVVQKKFQIEELEIGLFFGKEISESIHSFFKLKDRICCVTKQGDLHIFKRSGLHIMTNYLLEGRRGFISCAMPYKHYVIALALSENLSPQILITDIRQPTVTKSYTPEVNNPALAANGFHSLCSEQNGQLYLVASNESIWVTSIPQSECLEEWCFIEEDYYSHPSQALNKSLNRLLVTHDMLFTLNHTYDLTIWEKMPLGKGKQSNPLHKMALLSEEERVTRSHYPLEGFFFIQNRLILVLIAPSPPEYFVSTLDWARSNSYELVVIEKGSWKILNRYKLDEVDCPVNWAAFDLPYLYMSGEHESCRLDFSQGVFG